MNPTTIGLVGGLLTTIAVIPQIYRSWRTRHVRDISLWQPLLLSVGMVFWLWYGIILNDLPLIAANIISLALNITLVVFKFRFAGNDPPAEPNPFID